MSSILVFPYSYTDFALSMDTSAPNRINNFDITNFHTWKFKMQMVLDERDLWEVVSGEIKMDQCVTQLDQAAFKHNFRKALAIIRLAMEIRSCRWSGRRVEPMMHGRGWKEISRKRASQTSSFFVDASLRPRWKKAMM